MKRLYLMLLLLPALCLTAASPEFIQAAAQEAKPLRIGVDIQTGFQSCLDTWQALADYLSQEIPEYRFAIVPLASKQDLVDSLARDDVQFTLTNPVLEEISAELFDTVPLATMIITDRKIKKPYVAGFTYGGAIVRRADRNDIRRIKDLRAQNLSAEKPWALSGWIAQWGFLVEHGIYPEYDLKRVVFEGSGDNVIKSVLDGTSDAGAVSAAYLARMIKHKQIPAASLYVINRQGIAVPIVGGEDLTSTANYPRWAFSKTPAVSEELAQRVTAALMKKDILSNFDGAPIWIAWTTPQNYGSVRRLLQSLLGPRFAESPGYPPQKAYPVWFFPMLAGAFALSAVTVAFIFLFNRFRQREIDLKERLQETRSELLAARAERQRIDAIMNLCGCGVDIIDEDYNMVYADPGLEQTYGDWRGRKCHEYYHNSPVKCEECRRPAAYCTLEPSYQDIDDANISALKDPHAQIHRVAGQKVRMVGVPFRDEGGRRLYARMHMPVAEELDRDLAAENAASVGAE